MRALIENRTETPGFERPSSLFRSIINSISHLSETIWLGITFTLFVIMGPFSVIAVLYGLWTLANGENKERMTEPASC